MSFPYRIPLENLCVNEVMPDEAFITSLSTSLNEKSKRKDDRLCHVRKDHNKLMDVVKTFGSRVSIMINNQRNDYMTAYEKHMLEVQKELRQLQEKVLEIANDSTRDEKIRSLEDIQTKMKSESVLLDQQNSEMTKRLKSLTVTMQSTERDRDWLLTRLKKAKKKNASLATEANSKNEKLFEDTYALDYSDEEMPVPSALFGIYQKNSYASDSVIDPSKRLTPIITPGDLPPKTGRSAATLSDSLSSNSSLCRGRWIEDVHSTSLTLHRQRDQCSSKENNLIRKKEEKKDLSSLVRMRERKKGVREVVRKCMLVANRESTAKHRSESLSFSDLVLLCLQAVEENMKSEENYKKIVKLNKSYDNDNNYGDNYDKNNDKNDNFEDNDNSNSGDTHKNNKSNHNNDDHGNIVAVSRFQNKNESSCMNRNDIERDEYHIKGRDEQICGEKNRRAKLVQKLLEHPATYLAVLDILDSKYVFPPTEIVSEEFFTDKNQG